MDTSLSLLFENVIISVFLAESQRSISPPLNESENLTIPVNGENSVSKAKSSQRESNKAEALVKKGISCFFFNEIIDNIFTVYINLYSIKKCGNVIKNGGNEDIYVLIKARRKSKEILRFRQIPKRIF